MTTVDDFGEYTGVNGVVTVGGTVLADVQYDVSWETETVSGARASKYSDVNIPGKRKVTTTLKKSLVREDAAVVIGMSLNATPITGTAEALLAASGVLDGSDTYTAMTDDEIATESQIKLTLQTNATTSAGTATLIGEDTAGNAISEVLIVPAGMQIGATLTTAKTFKKVFGLLTYGVDSTSDLGTFKVDSIVGASVYTFGPPAVFELVGTVTKGAHSIAITQPGCWFKKGGLAWEDAGKIIEVDLPVEMHDPDLLTATVT